MTKAEEIIEKIGEFNPMVFQKKYRNKGTISVDEAIKMINEARKEAIEECAERATEYMKDWEGFSYGIVEKIESLINELK